VAQRRRCAVVYLRHLNKSNGTKAIYRGGGSIAIIGAARSGMLVARDPDDETGKLKVLAHTKHNLSAEQPSLTYQLEYVEALGVCRLQWQGESAKKADDLLAVLTEEQKEEKEQAQSKLDQACQWLHDFLAEGPQPVKLCHQEAVKLGIARRTLERAAKQIESVFVKEDGEWSWRLPEGPA
jgi:RecA-family ATPase